MILPGPYFAPMLDSSLKDVGNAVVARERFFRCRPRNLDYLLRQRYEWMNGYIAGLTRVVEFGAGAGLSREYISNPKLILTDYETHPWIDMQADALNPPFGPESLDAIICSHMIHHLAFPAKFMRLAASMLRPGGYLLIQEVHCSLLLRVLMRVLKIEGWSYDVDVFNEDTATNNLADPWSGNNAVPDLLFTDTHEFSRRFPNLEIIRNELCECLVVLLAGGVTAHRRTLQLPEWILAATKRLDDGIAALLPSTFALGRRVVVRKAR
ncbi:MAG: hypothetical protein A2W25_01315 [candidate division Zixibacteria bacterium RBG_16_53_22]|nr:MAG: hypothetical protein A2W25_01315 [candidate division Zixibacteria bacterium RBG_16_53_22]